MQSVQSEDITVQWGGQPHPLDVQFSRWRLAVFQDVQESLDQQKLYFLYDPDMDERSMTTGARKGGASLVVFDVNLRCFVAELPISCYGKVKFLFALKAPSSAGGTAFVLVTETDNGGMSQLHLSRLELWQDGNAIADLKPLLNSPISMAGEYIISMREDAPEIVVMANPGMQVWRIDAMASQPSEPTSYFSVPGADLTHFYDGFVTMGNVILLSSFADGNLDYSRVHVLNLANPGQINTHNCSPDPARGMPPARKQAAIDARGGHILMAGGEINFGPNVTRLSDYWVLDIGTFQWAQVPATMPIPLIEPRLTTTYSGNIYLWGDFDQPLPGMPAGTHLRIIRIKGLGDKAPPPPYSQTPSSVPNPSPYPNLNPQYPAQPAAPYPPSNVPYPPASGQQAPPYPSYQPNPSVGYGQPQQQYPPYQGQGQFQDQYGGYADQSGSGMQPGQQYPGGETAYYPPKKDKKKDCSIQ